MYPYCKGNLQFVCLLLKIIKLKLFSLIFIWPTKNKLDPLISYVLNFRTRNQVDPSPLLSAYMPEIVLFKSPRNCKRRNKGNFTFKCN